MRASALLAIFTCITANLVSLSLAGKHPGEWEWKDLTDDGYVFSCSSKDGDWDKMTPKTDMISPNYCYNHCTCDKDGKSTCDNKYLLDLGGPGAPGGVKTPEDVLRICLAGLKDVWSCQCYGPKKSTVPA